MFFVIILGSLIAIQVVSAVCVLKLFKNNPLLKYVLLGFIFLGFICFIAAMFFSAEAPVRIGYILSEAGFDWLISLPLVFVLLILLSLLSGFGLLAPAYRAKAFYAGFLLILLILACGRYGFYRITVPEYDITLAAGRAPVRNDTIRIAAVSDLHLGNYINKGSLKRFADAMNAQNPDVMFFAGDIIDRDITPLIEQNMAEEFAKLNPPLGKYLIPGNHEGYGNEDAAAVDAYYKSAGFTVLRDSAVLVDSLFYLVGRSDNRRTRMSTDEILGKYMPEINDSIPVIVLDHRPATYEEWNTRTADKYPPFLVISGHTHNGQIFPFNKIVKAIYPHYHGHFTEGGTHYITGAGLGLWGPKFRLGTRSEIVDIKLYYK